MHRKVLGLEGCVGCAMRALGAHGCAMAMHTHCPGNGPMQKKRQGRPTWPPLRVSQAPTPPERRAGLNLSMSFQALLGLQSSASAMSLSVSESVTSSSF